MVLRLLSSPAIPGHPQSLVILPLEGAHRDQACDHNLHHWNVLIDICVVCGHEQAPQARELCMVTPDPYWWPEGGELLPLPDA